jgi:leucyl-tRNA synthetase
VNGKVRSLVKVSKNASKDEVIAIVKADDKISAAIEGKTIVKEIVVPGKIINIVVK